MKRLIQRIGNTNEKKRILLFGGRIGSMVLISLLLLMPKVLADNEDPAADMDMLRKLFYAMVNDVAHFYHVTLGLMTFLFFVVITLVAFSIVNYLRFTREIRELQAWKEAQEAKNHLAAAKKVTPAPPVPKKEKPKQPEAKTLQDFLRAYEEASTLPESEAQQACQALGKQYALRSFSCANRQEREQNPSVSPTFQDAKNGDFWAYKDGTSANYFIVPSLPLHYDEDARRYGGMKEVFASNYETGKQYRSLKVAAPAVFSAVGSLWAPIRPGKIFLVEADEAQAKENVEKKPH